MPIDTTRPDVAGRGHTLSVLELVEGMYNEYVQERVEVNRRIAHAQGRGLGRQWVGDPAAYQRARQMRLAGVSVTAIAKDTGISRRTLIRHFRQTGIPLPSDERRTPLDYGT